MDGIPEHCCDVHLGFCKSETEMTYIDTIIFIATLVAYIVMIAVCAERLDNWIMGRYTRDD